MIFRAFWLLGGKKSPQFFLLKVVTLRGKSGCWKAWVAFFADCVNAVHRGKSLKHAPFMMIPLFPFLFIKLGKVKVLLKSQVKMSRFPVDVRYADKAAAALFHGLPASKRTWHYRNWPQRRLQWLAIASYWNQARTPSLESPTDDVNTQAVFSRAAAA